MKIFVDFDDVLFNSRWFIEDLNEIFERYGISVKYFRESYESIRILENTTAGYNFDKHVEYLRTKKVFDEKLLCRDVGGFLRDLKKYIFNDSREFLQFFHESGYEIYLISYGLSDFQKKKVAGTQLQGYFTRSIVGDVEKGDVIKEIMKTNSSDDVNWFLDDRVKFISSVKAKCENVQTVLVCRSEGRYCDVQDDSCDFQVKDLIEARKVILGGVS